MGKTKTLPPGKHADFGQRLTRALNEKGLSPDTTSRSALAKRWGVKSASFVSDILNGHKLPKMDTARRIAVDLDVATEWLLTGRGEPRIGGEESLFDGLPPDVVARYKASIDEDKKLRKALREKTDEKTGT